MLSIPIRALIKVYDNIMEKASYACDVNASTDHSELVGLVDAEEKIYNTAIRTYKEKLIEWNVDLVVFMAELKRYDEGWKGGGDSVGLRYMILELKIFGLDEK